MTRLPGVTAVPVMSGMPSWPWEGVWGLSWPAASDMRFLAGVAVDARSELRWASFWAWRRLAFSRRSSLRGTLCELAGPKGATCVERVGLLYGRLLRRGSRRVLCRARHGCFGWVDVIAFVVGVPAGSPSRGGVCGLVCQQPGQGPSAGQSAKNNYHATSGEICTATHPLHRHIHIRLNATRTRLNASTPRHDNGQPTQVTTPATGPLLACCLSSVRAVTSFLFNLLSCTSSTLLASLSRNYRATASALRPLV